MALRTPTSFTAGRKLTLAGSTYQPGAVVPNAEVKKIKNLSAYLSRRILIPNVTTRQSKNHLLDTPSPQYLNPVQVRGL
jgi:hypothetical protein